MTTEPENAFEIDIRGQTCPSCLLIALKEVNAYRDTLKEQGRTLRILTDSRHSTGTIPDSVRNMGYQAKVEKIGNYYCIVVHK